MSLQWRHSVKQKPLTDLKCRILAPLQAYRRTGKSGYDADIEDCRVCAADQLVEISSVCYFGKKAINDKWLNELNDIALAFWYMDDGSLSQGNKTQRPRAMFHTEGWNKTDVEKMCGYLRMKYGYVPVVQEYHGYQAIRLNADDAEKFWELIAKFVIPEFRYKLAPQFRSVENFWERQ